MQEVHDVPWIKCGKIGKNTNVEKIHLLDKLFSGMSYSAADHEFNVNDQL